MIEAQAEFPELALRNLDHAFLRCYSDYMERAVDIIATFTGPELSKAGNMPGTTFDFLIRDGIVPPPVSPGKRGSPARWPFSVFSRIVMTRAMTRVVEGHVMAARIASGIAEGLADQGKPHIPFGFEDLQRKLHSEIGQVENARGPDGEFCPYRTIEAAWRHGILDETRSAPNDYILVIVNGEMVGESNWRGIKLLMQNPKNDGIAWPVLRYRYGGRSHGLDVREMRSEADETLFVESLKNAETVVQLNLSLALRRAVVATIKSREGK